MTFVDSIMVRVQLHDLCVADVSFRTDDPSLLLSDRRLILTEQHGIFGADTEHPPAIAEGLLESWTSGPSTNVLANELPIYHCRAIMHWLAGVEQPSSTNLNASWGVEPAPSSSILHIIQQQQEEALLELSSTAINPISIPQAKETLIPVPGRRKITLD